LTYNNNDGCGEGCDSNNLNTQVVSRLLEPKILERSTKKKHLFSGKLLLSWGNRDSFD
jgi:hypothetical protein